MFSSKLRQLLTSTQQNLNLLRVGRSSSVLQLQSQTTANPFFQPPRPPAQNVYHSRFFSAAVGGRTTRRSPTNTRDCVDWAPGNRPQRDPGEDPGEAAEEEPAASGSRLHVRGLLAVLLVYGEGVAERGVRRFVQLATAADCFCAHPLPRALPQICAWNAHDPCGQK